MTTIFTKIINRELPADIVYEDEVCVCIRDIRPRAPVHLLLIPRKPVISLAHLQEEDRDMIAHLMFKVKSIAADHGIGGHFRTNIHTGSGGGQEVFHLHIHVLGDPSLVPDSDA